MEVTESRESLAVRKNIAELALARAAAEKFQIEAELAELNKQERAESLFPLRFSYDCGLGKKSEIMGILAEEVGFVYPSEGYTSLMYIGTDIRAFFVLQADGNWDIVGFEWSDSRSQTSHFGTTWPYNKERENHNDLGITAFY